MKNVLIFSHALELGGAETALLGLLESIDKTEYQVDLFLMRHEGELLPYIPSDINLLPEIPQYASLAVPMTCVLKKRQFGVLFGRLKAKIKAKRRVEELQLKWDNDVGLQLSHKYTLKSMPQISDTEYDLAISFLTPHYFVAEKVKAKKKIAWIHTDYSTVSIDKEEQLKMWDKYDYIASISDNVTESFVSVFPSLKEKIVLIENILPKKYILSKIDEFSVESEMPDDGSIKLLSIGRFCTAKNFDNVPDICKRLIEKGLNVKWYLIGYGGDEQLIKNKIAEAEMQDRVVILGKKENPYPYIKVCDIYVQPSRYEGKSVSVREAQIINKPVIITAYSTSGSQMKDGFDGVIVPMDNKGCAEGVARVIENKELQQRLIENTKTCDYTNAEEIEKIYKLIG
ncbi:MAG: glycosyltransferase [Clostridia bacterium]|nr:glycosyltransferase [Clostridia bacterium]